MILLLIYSSCQQALFYPHLQYSWFVFVSFGVYESLESSFDGLQRIEFGFVHMLQEREREIKWISNYWNHDLSSIVVNTAYFCEL